MSNAAYKRLVERYADGRRPCNCKEAYYSDDLGHSFDANGKVHLGQICQHGCSANRLTVRDQIAERVEAELAANGQ